LHSHNIYLIRRIKWLRKEEYWYEKANPALFVKIFRFSRVRFFRKRGINCYNCDFISVLFKINDYDVKALIHKIIWCSFYDRLRVFQALVLSPPDIKVNCYLYYKNENTSIDRRHSFFRTKLLEVVMFWLAHVCHQLDYHYNWIVTPVMMNGQITINWCLFCIICSLVFL